MFPALRVLMTAVSCFTLINEIIPQRDDTGFNAMTKAEYDLAMTIYADVKKSNEVPGAVKVSHNQLAKVINKRLGTDVSGHELKMMWYQQITREELPEWRGL